MQVASLLKWLYALGVVAASFFITLWTMNYFSPLCPQGDAVTLSPPFEKAGAVSWFVQAPSLAEFADSVAGARSNAVVCEDNVALGPAHSPHPDIATKGVGRFSHWNTGFVISASDNTDPNKNGRSYVAVRPR
ncbi:MAG: uncharacterized protein JWR80_3886 [Bradyrhizobium sp.]|nr:uncharacterized protein [Bradyrhizobium sp.]